MKIGQYCLCLSVILLRSVSCVFTIKIGLDWIGQRCKHVELEQFLGTLSRRAGLSAIAGLSCYPRDAMLARVFARATCPSVRLSRAGIVSKRRKLA